MQNDVITEFYKENPKDKIWWVESLMEIEEGVYVKGLGKHMFSFDRKKVYNVWVDYPHNLTAEQKELFDKENPYWADFFKDREA